MGDEFYLIAHKVRGQPAFDIAIKVQIGDEEGWVVPTSGHRAYPFTEYLLSELYWAPTVDDPKIPITDASESIMAKDWSDWPDHYPTPSEAKQTGAELLKELGITVRDWPTRFVRRI